MKSEKVKNNVWIMDAIEECGVSIFLDSWPKNNWKTIPEPKFNIHGNKEPDPKKAKEQEILEEVLDKISFWIQKSLLQPFVLIEGRPITIPDHRCHIRTVIEYNGKTPQSCSIEILQNKEIFIDRGMLNQCLYPARNSQKSNKNIRSVRKRATRSELEVILSALKKEYTEGMARNHFEKEVRRRVLPKVAEPVIMRKLHKFIAKKRGRPSLLK